MVLIGDVVPDPLVEEAGHVLHRPGHDLQHPVDEVGAPIVEGAARDLLVGAPPAAGVAPAAAVRLDVKHFANDTPIDDVSDCTSGVTSVTVSRSVTAPISSLKSIRR